jgi:hypothetical protein
MSLQKELDKIEADIDQIRLDPKYLQLKNRKRSQHDTIRYNKYTRQLNRLIVQKKAIIKKMRDAGVKPQKHEQEPGKYMESKPAWRNQTNKVAHRNQDDGKISRNWVRERKENKEVATEFPAKRNAIESAKPDPDSVTINYKKTSNTPARLFVKRMLKQKYHKPVVRNASQMARFKEDGKARMERRMHPVNETVRSQSKKTTSSTKHTIQSKQVPQRRQKTERKTRAFTEPSSRENDKSDKTTKTSKKLNVSNSYDSQEQLSRTEDDDELGSVNNSGSGSASDDNMEDSEELIDDLSN